MIKNKTIIGSFLLLSTLQCFGMEPKDQLFINAALLNTIAQEAQQVLHDEETALEVNAADDETALGQEPASKRRRYECPICKKSVANSTQHMRIHTGVKPHQCNQCDLSFASSGDLTKHMRSHTGETPYPCDECDLSFAKNSNLTRHKRIHTGEKPFKCEQCDFSCTQGGNLTIHMRYHTGERPYQCKRCDYSCASGNELTIHIRTHTGEKPFKCDPCNYSCVKSSGLKKHMMTKKHKDLQTRTDTEKKDYISHQVYADTEQK